MRALLEELDEGFVFVNLIETDQVYGHRKDVRGFAAALEAIDGFVGVAARRACARTTCWS